MIRSRMRGLRLLACCLALLSVCGCRLRQSHLTVISNRNINLDRVDLDKLEGKRVQAEDTGLYLLGIPLLPPRLQNAVDKAMKKADADLMTDVVVHTSFVWIVVGIIKTVKVEGIAVKTRGTVQQ